MIDELPIPETPEKEVPRWVQVLVGLVLALLTLLCGFASLTMLVVPNEKSPILAIVVGFVLLLGCLWVFEKCFRLLTGRKNRGGLMTPNTLRVVSFFFLALPVAGLFTGYYRKMGLVAIFQAVMYFFSFLGLRALARKREANGVSNGLRARRAKEREAKRRRDLLEESVRTHLLPALIKQGFEVAPAQVHPEPVDREYLRSFPSWGKLIRAREPLVDLVKIQFSTYGRAAFRINACAVPKEGMMTAGGHRTTAEVIELGAHDLEMCARPRWFIFFSLFSMGLRRFRSPVQADYEKLALRVAGLLPELELALREGKLGPHMRRLDSSLFKPLPPEVLERIRRLKADRAMKK